MNTDYIAPQPLPSVEQQEREVEQQRQDYQTISEQFGKMRSGSQGNLETAKNVGCILLRRWILKRPDTE